MTIKSASTSTPLSRDGAIELAPFAEKLKARAPEIAQAITERIWSEIPAYAALGDLVEKSRVKEAAARNVSAFLGALGEGRRLTRQDIDELGVVGEERAGQGIPLEDMLRAFRMVGSVLWEQIGQQMRALSHPPMDAVVELGAILMQFTDQLSSSVAQHYTDALGNIVRRQEASRREFLQDLLVGGYSSDDSMIQRARGFGYDLVANHLAVAAKCEDSDEDAGRHEQSLIRALDSLGQQLPISGRALVGSRSGITIGLLATPAGLTSKPTDVGGPLAAALGENWSIGVGGLYPGLEGCRRSYLEAREALEIGSVVDRRRRVYPFEDFLFYLFLRADRALTERFVSFVLGGAIEHDKLRRSDLVTSLETYFATDESAKETGKRLYAHPHTITYRLKQIQRLTGRSLKDPEDKLHLQVAIKALRILQGTPVKRPASTAPSRNSGEAKRQR